MYFVYVLRSESKPNETYTGYTSDLDRRLQQHNDKENNGYTKKFQPWYIEAYVRCDTEETATNVEDYFKNGSGVERFADFEKANPHHRNPRQGFFDTLEAGRAFRKMPYRVVVTKDNGTVFTMYRPKDVNNASP